MDSAFRQSALKTRCGFTLIELLIAISILAIVAVLGWRGLDTIVRTRITLTSDLEQTRGMQLAFAQMQSDCEYIAGFDDVGRRVTLLAEPNRLVLVRTVYADNQPTRLQVVAYRILNGILSRQESEPTRDLRVLDELWRVMAGDTAGATPVPLQSDVGAMNIRVWIRNSGWRASGGQYAPVTSNTTISNTGTSESVFPTGLEVALRMGARESSIVKVMLLGAM